MDTDTNKAPDTLVTPAASRLGFIKMAAAASAGLVVGGRIPDMVAHAATDDPPTIIGVALVAEYLAVTFQSNALRNAAVIGLTPAEITTVQAIVATEALHVAYLRAFGAQNIYTGPFAFPAGTFTSRSGYATTGIILETAFVAAYMAATREFASDARADLAQLTYQLGAVEAEHRALSRAVGGFTPFSDVAFESNLLTNVAQAATVLTNLGFLSPTAGNSYPYLDTDQAAALSYANLLTQKTPG